MTRWIIKNTRTGESVEVKCSYFQRKEKLLRVCKARGWNIDDTEMIVVQQVTV